MEGVGQRGGGAGRGSGGGGEGRKVLHSRWCLRHHHCVCTSNDPPDFWAIPPSRSIKPDTGMAARTGRRDETFCGHDCGGVDLNAAGRQAFWAPHSLAVLLRPSSRHTIASPIISAAPPRAVCVQLTRPSGDGLLAQRRAAAAPFRWRRPVCLLKVAVVGAAPPRGSIGRARGRPTLSAVRRPLPSIFCARVACATTQCYFWKHNWLANCVFFGCAYHLCE